MNRADLSWALAAVLPHAGKYPRPSFVGIEHHEDHLYFYATDRYTLGIARVGGFVPAFSCQLLPKEAQEVEQFVRPRRVTEREQEVACANVPGELHIGFPDNGDTAVFETVEPVLSWQAVLDLTALALSRETQWQSVKVNPSFLARFAKAERENSNIHIEPKQGKETGSLLVTAGEDFIGLAMQIAYNQPISAVDFPSWPWTERKAS